MARLFLEAGETYGLIGPFGTTDVIGTNGNETVIVQANGKATFDPSFNRGGDEIEIQGDSTDFLGGLSGSSLLITSDNGASIRIPFGSAGTTITFQNGSFDLVFANGAITLGEQVITGTPTALENLGEGIAASALSAEPSADGFLMLG